MDYEVVYSAAMERQGRGLSLSAYHGASTLASLRYRDTLNAGDVAYLYRTLERTSPTLRDRLRHRFRSTVK